MYGFWVSPIPHNSKFLAESDGSGNDNVSQNEKKSDGGIEHQVDDNEIESGIEESSEDEWIFPDGDSHSKFLHV